jgi:hypothetical protein
VFIFNDEAFLAICFLAFIFATYFQLGTFFSCTFKKRSTAIGLNLFYCLVPHFNVLYYSYVNNILSNYIIQANHFDELSTILRTCPLFNYKEKLLCVSHTEAFMAPPSSLLDLYYALETKVFSYTQTSSAQTVLFFLRPLLIAAPNYLLPTVPTSTRYVSRCAYLLSPSNNVGDF